MIIVDDHLALRALAAEDGTLWLGETPSVPWGLYFRLLRALHGSRSNGTLSRNATQQMIAYAKAPPSDVLKVIDPRPHTVTTATLMNRYPLSLVAADLLGAAKQHGEAIHAAEGNVGIHWADVCDREAIELRIISVPNHP